MRLMDIEPFTRDGNYQINQPWDALEPWLDQQRNEIGLDLDPDYQRAHVWTTVQQVRFVEFCLRGGKGSNTLRFNCPGWMKDFKGPVELVDGKQRLEAVRRFMRDDLPVFGLTVSQYDGPFPFARYDFLIRVNDLPTRREVLQWYLDINTGGVAHTDDEILQVTQLLADENEL